MPELRDDHDAKDAVTEVLTVQYRGLITDELVSALMEEFAREDAEHMREAVRRHIRNTGLNRSNEPTGKYPPSVADLLHQLQQIRLEEQRLATEAEAAQRRAESDRAGESVMQRLDWPKLTGEWGRKRAAITQALRADLHLDLMRWEDCQILRAVHKVWADSCWEPDPGTWSVSGVDAKGRPVVEVRGGWLPSGREMTVAQCVELGRRLLDEQRGSRRQEAA